MFWFSSFFDRLSLGALASEGNFMDALPDPMKLDFIEVGFVIALVSALYFFLKGFFFKPLIKVMDERESTIQSGAQSKGDAAKRMTEAQAAFDLKLREMRAKSFEQRKALTQAAQAEKDALLVRSRQRAEGDRQAGLQELARQRDAAERELATGIDQLAESMTQQLLKV